MNSFETFMINIGNSWCTAMSKYFRNKHIFYAVLLGKLALNLAYIILVNLKYVLA